MGWNRGLVIERVVVDGCQLGTPYVLWDSRTWDGSMGLGTAGLPNLGMAGTAFDLDVAQFISGSDVYTFARQNNGAYTASPSVDWSDLGGEPCVAPFTFITAIGRLPPNISGLPDPDGYVEADIIFSNQGLYCQSYIFPAFGVVEDKAENGAFTQIYVTNGNFDYQYALWSPPNTEVEGSADVYIREQLLVVTLTPSDETGTMYRVPYPSGTPISVAENTVNGLQEEFDVYSDPSFCAVPAEPIAGDTHFFYFGEDRRIGSGLVPGEPWNSGIGAALFRGCPSETDLAQWYDYFYSDYVSSWGSPYAYMFSSSGPTTRVDATHTYYIWDGFSGISLSPIPGAPLPDTIDLFMVGGGGAGQDTGVGAMGGGAAGEVKYVYGHPAPTVTTMAVRGSGGGVLNAKGGDTTFDGLSARGGDRGGTPGSGIGAGNGVYVGGNPVGGTAGGGGAGGGGNGDDAVSATVAGDGGGFVVNNWRTGSNDLYARGGGGGGQAGGVTFGIGGEYRGSGGRARNGVSSPPINGSNGILIIRHTRMDL